MRMLNVNIMSFDAAMELAKDNATQAMTGVSVGSVLTFSSIEQLTKVMLAPNRLSIINTMAGEDAMSIRELARRVNRDFRGVHSDVQALLNAGVIDRDGNGIVFPFDAYHIEFTGGKIAA